MRCKWRTGRLPERCASLPAGTSFLRPLLGRPHFTLALVQNRVRSKAQSRASQYRLRNAEIVQAHRHRAQYGRQVADDRGHGALRIREHDVLALRPLLHAMQDLTDDGRSSEQYAIADAYIGYYGLDHVLHGGS